ncbi:MAG: hypothetical protein FWF91_08060 [Coriobacteriia bacterium]|nr:hypothetical protein [Coriobacteriia bacterium]
MKRALIIVFTIAVLLLAACSGSPKTSGSPPAGGTSGGDQSTAPAESSTTPEESSAVPEESSAAKTPASTEQEAKPSGSGYYTTAPERLPLTLQTPDAWIYIDPSEADMDKLVGVLGDAGFAESILQQVKNTDIVIFYDTANYTADFKANMNITMQDVGPISQNDLANSIDNIKLSCETSFSQAPFEKFSWIEAPNGQTLGGNYYVVFVANYTSGIPITGVMAYAVHNNHLFQFTYSIPQSAYNDKIYDEFEKMLSSVEFL